MPSPGNNAYARSGCEIMRVRFKEFIPTPHRLDMKKLIALAVMPALSQAASALAGPPPPSSSEEVVPAPAPPPASFFRPSEFDIGAFGTYVTGTGNIAVAKSLFRKEAAKPLG